jgi:hypothetical protein
VKRKKKSHIRWLVQRFDAELPGGWHVHIWKLHDGWTTVAWIAAEPTVRIASKRKSAQEAKDCVVKWWNQRIKKARKS